MSINNRSIIDIISERFSCRTFQNRAIPSEMMENLQSFIQTNQEGPFGNDHRFKLVAVGKDDANILHGLGTYGFIKGAKGYLIGASIPSGMYLEDFGFLMEKFILAATAYGLGSCWLGGSFTRSSFGKRILLNPDEELPAVVALGIIEDPEIARKGFIRKQAGSYERRNWETMFHKDEFNQSLEKTTAGKYAQALEMIRKAPSASNKQPWQIVMAGTDWHFFLKRTHGYRDGNINKMLSISDLQRIDSGIAMCHFQLTAQELGLKGSWIVADPKIKTAGNKVEYTATWRTA
ncbi:MAG TPA: nitroreductase family protein [Anaerolineales bacterium]|nr:nitroreductase family protein [Anaerolineales bacterium]